MDRFFALLHYASQVLPGISDRAEPLYWGFAFGCLPYTGHGQQRQENAIHDAAVAPIDRNRLHLSAARFRTFRYPLHVIDFELADCCAKKFAETLMECVGKTGTVFIWSHHEQSVLRDVAEQMTIYGYENQVLARWLYNFAGTKNAVPSRLTDLCDLAKKRYFHPKMKGKLSIKYVLPAIWEENHELHEHASFGQYFRKGSNGDIIDPYQIRRFHRFPSEIQKTTPKKLSPRVRARCELTRKCSMVCRSVMTKSR